MRKFRNIKKILKNVIKILNKKINLKQNLKKRSTATNSGFKKWRKKCKIHVYFPQEILSLTENNRFRSSPLLEATRRYGLFSYRTIS